jgi:hypothetical protein
LAKAIRDNLRRQLLAELAELTQLTTSEVSPHKGYSI